MKKVSFTYRKMTSATIYMIYLLTIIILFFFIDSIEFTQWLRVVGGIIVTHILLSYFCFYYSEIKVFSLVGIFVALSYLFHFGQLIIWFINPNYVFTRLNLYQIVDHSILKRTVVFSLAAVSAVNIGIICTSFCLNYTKNKIVLTKSQLTKFSNIGWIIIGITFPLKLYIDLKILIASMNDGYLSSFKHATNGVITQIAEFYIIGLVLLMIGYSYNKKKVICIFGISCLYSCFTMLSGGRGRQVLIIVMLLYVLFSIIDRPKTFTIFALVFLGALGVMALNTIAEVRNTGIYSIKYLLENIKMNQANPFLKILEEAGASLYTVSIVLDKVPSNIDFATGATYFKSFASVLPDIGDFFAEINTSANYVKNLNVAYIGGSYIGELYYNFGFFSVIVALGIGGFINTISVRFHNGIMKKDYKMAYYVMIFVASLWWVRDVFGGLLRCFFWGYAVIWMLKKLFIKQHYLVIKHIRKDEIPHYVR